MTHEPVGNSLKILQKTLSLRDDIALSFLFGSKARGDSHEQSDWDIAILFKDNTNGWENLGKQEEIRRLLSRALATNDDNIDLVDLYRGGLSINATVVDEGIPLTGQNSLALAIFYQRIWANLEDYYWNLDHVS
ncbi:MAG TPA: nucleotidyltransferase domain-containing protein [Gammaproteobacteria bacterium]|nr:nucleotidyltransferase domain-containing protein [Gammaproteobacteria bacterium]